MKTWIITSISALLLCFSNLSLAEQKADLGNWEVHYVAFNSTFIPSEVAKVYHLTRSRNYSLINISVLAKNQSGKPAQEVQISGIAKNLIGNQKNLEFKEIKEGESVYYLAELRHSNEETFNFDIQISQGKQQQTLKFTQKFYVD